MRLPCPIFLGAQSLTLHQISRGTDIDLDIEEQIGTFPLTLRITGYLPPPVAPPPSQLLSDTDALVYKLPIIKIKGASIGSDQNSSEQRRISGTVRMIGDGAVRWSMVSSKLCGVKTKGSSSVPNLILACPAHPIWRKQ